MNSIKEFIESINIKITSQDKDANGFNRYWSKCPIHIEKTPSFCFTDYTWRCWGCNKHGKLYNLYAIYYNVSIDEAKKSCPAVKVPKPNKAQEESVVQKTYDLDYALSQYPLAYYSIGYKYIPKKLIDEYKIRDITSLVFKSHYTNTTYTIQNRIAFPIYLNGVLQAITSRANFDDTGNKCKYLFTPFAVQKRDCVFGIDQVELASDLYIVEGPMDVLALRAMGYSAIATLGSGITTEQYRIIIDTAIKKEVIRLLFLCDGDESGQNNAQKLRESLPNSPVQLHYEIRICEDGYDPYSIYTRDVIKV